MFHIGLLIALTSVAGACASASARSRPADLPPLNVPAPPPHVVEPAPPPEPGPDPVGDLPPTQPAAAPSKPVHRESAPKPEPKPETKETPPEPPAAAPPPPTQPVPQLRTPETVDTSEAAKAVGATLDRARAMLGSVNFAALSNERKKAYNDVKMFLEQAENAVKQGNYGFAQGVATKAETLARELAGK